MKPANLNDIIQLFTDLTEDAADTVARSFVVGQAYEEVRLKPLYPQVFMELPTQTSSNGERMDYRFALNLVVKYAQDQSDLGTKAQEAHAALWEFLLEAQRRAPDYRFQLVQAQNQLFLLQYLPGNTLGYRVELRAVTGVPTNVDYPWQGA